MRVGVFFLELLELQLDYETEHDVDQHHHAGMTFFGNQTHGHVCARLGSWNRCSVLDTTGDVEMSCRMASWLHGSVC